MTVTRDRDHGDLTLKRLNVSCSHIQPINPSISRYNHRKWLGIPSGDSLVYFTIQNTICEQSKSEKYHRKKEVNRRTKLLGGCGGWVGAVVGWERWLGECGGWVGAVVGWVRNDWRQL